MAKDPAFDIVAELRTDDTQLIAGMRRAERVVDKSAQRMGAAVTDAAAGTDKLQRSLAAAGAAGTLAGTRFGGVASAAAGFAGSIQSLGLALGPVGIAIAAISLALIAFRDELFSSTSASEGFTEGLTTLSERAQKAKDELAILRGEVTKFELERRAIEQSPLTEREKAEQLMLLRGAQSSERQLEQEKAKAAARSAARRMRAAERAAENLASKQGMQQLRMLQVQTDLLAGRITEEDAIRRTHSIEFATLLIEQRRLRIANEKQKADEASALAKDQEAKAILLQRELTRRQEHEMAVRNRHMQLGPSGGFSISAANIDAFRFGAVNGPATFLGQQKTEQQNTTRAVLIGNEQRARLLAIAERAELENSLPSRSSGGMRR